VAELVDIITQFRMATYEHFPYLSPYVYSLTPVERPGIGTMAVDKYGRLYYDPSFCEKVTLEQGAYVVLHESWHLILRHCHRAPKIIGENPTGREHFLLNVAMDIVVWEMLESIAKDCPEGGVTFDKVKADFPKIERNMTIEQLYAILTEEEEPQEKEPGEDGEQGEKEDNQDVGNPGKEKSDDQGGEPQEEDSDGGDGETKPDDGTPKTDGKGRGQDNQGKSEGNGEGKPEYDLVGGGSAADGLPRDYEEEPDHAWESFKEDRLLEAVENKIEQVEQDREWMGGRGTVPAGLKRLIKEKLRPQPNPWDRLRATVAKCAANHRGSPDYTYRRPNRRQEAVEARLKGVQKYSPKAVVIVDTSGSMTARCLAKALVVIKQGLQALGQVPVVTCDAKVHQDQTLTSVHQEFEIMGGGGTDMRVPITYTQEKYKPDVTVLVTDTGTPWPDRPIKGQLIVAATQDGFVPPWATKVRIPDSPDKNTLEDDE
jgi:predicted metal-dependent peptidase